MPKLPTAESLGRVYPDPPPHIEVPDLSGTAKGIGYVGQALQKFGQVQVAKEHEEERKKQALELLKAEALQMKGLNGIKDSLENDPDYNTHEKKFKQGAAALTQQTMDMISNPYAREQWSARAMMRNEKAREQIRNRTQTLRKHDQVIELENNLSTNLDIFKKSGVSKDDRSEAEKNILESINLAERTGIVSPAEARRLEKNYLTNASEEELNNRIASGDKIESILGDLGLIPSDVDGKLTIAPSGIFRHLASNQREKLGNAVKKSYKNQTIKEIDDVIKQIETTGEIPVYPNGKTVFDKAKVILNDNQLVTQSYKMQKAIIEHGVIAPLSSMTSSQAQQQLDNIFPSKTNRDAVFNKYKDTFKRFGIPYSDQAHFAMIDAIHKNAEKRWNKIRQERERDPAKSVENLEEVVKVKNALRGAGNNVQVTQAYEAIIDARLAAQKRIGLSEFQQKALTKQEAADLLKIPRNPSDDDVMKALTTASKTAQLMYGKYAKEALNDAINLHISGEENRESARDIAEGLMTSDTEKPKDDSSWIDNIKNFWTGLTGGDENPVPTQAEIQWLAKNPKRNGPEFDKIYGTGAAAKAIEQMGARK